MIAAAPWLVLTCRLLGGWALLDGAQWLSDARHWGSGSPLGWDLHRWQGRPWWRWSVFTALYSARGLAAMGLLQAGAGAWLVAGGPLPGLALAVVGLIGAAQALRGVGKGADKMALVVVTGTLLHLAGLRWHLPALVLAGVAWTGGQLTLAYAASGWSKLARPSWRDGEVLTRALTSYSWGAGWIVQLVRMPKLAPVMAWAIMLAEALFPLALLLPAPLLAAVLTGFGLFHVAIALVLGLNTYPLAFVAAYPATMLLGAWLRAHLGLG